MKRIFTIVVLIASLMFTSCEDFLTEDVRGQLNVDTYYKSIEECESAVTSCYQALTYGGWWQINTVWLLSEMCSDDAWMGNTTQSQSDYISLAHYQGNGASNGPISNFWQYRYKGILRCNIAIDRISALETPDTESRDRLVAVSYTWRPLPKFCHNVMKPKWGMPPVALLWDYWVRFISIRRSGRMPARR